MNLPEKALADASEAVQPLNGAAIVPVAESLPVPLPTGNLTREDRASLARIPLER